MLAPWGKGVSTKNFDYLDQSAILSVIEIDSSKFAADCIANGMMMNRTEWAMDKRWED